MMDFQEELQGRSGISVNLRLSYFCLKSGISYQNWDTRIWATSRQGISEGGADIKCATNFQPLLWILNSPDLVMP